MPKQDRWAGSLTRTCPTLQSYGSPNCNVENARSTSPRRGNERQSSSVRGTVCDEGSEDRRGRRPITAAAQRGDRSQQLLVGRADPQLVGKAGGQAAALEVDQPALVLQAESRSNRSPASPLPARSHSGPGRLAAPPRRGPRRKRGQPPFAGTNLRSVPARRVLRTNGDCPLFPSCGPTTCSVAVAPLTNEPAGSTASSVSSIRVPRRFRSRAKFCAWSLRKAWRSSWPQKRPRPGQRSQGAAQRLWRSEVKATLTPRPYRHQINSGSPSSEERISWLPGLGRVPT